MQVRSGRWIAAHLRPVQKAIGDEGFTAGTNGSLLKLPLKSVGPGFRPGHWSFFLCRHSSEQRSQNHYRALAITAYTELPTSIGETEAVSIVHQRFAGSGYMLVARSANYLHRTSYNI